jgi:HK97 family phage prohead protease
MKHKAYKPEDRVLRFFSCDVNITKRDDAQEDDGIRTITGRPIVFNSPYDVWGEWEERIDPHALDEADMTDVAFLVNHDDRMIPCARSRRNNENSTMRLNIVENEGVDMIANIDVRNNDTSRALASAVDRGDITGMSWAFTIESYEWQNLDTDYPTKLITRVGRVFEVSAVNSPAYTETSIHARNAEHQALESARAALESAKAEKRAELKAELLAELEKLGGQKNDH